VIAPATAHLQVPRREALALEAQPGDEGDRRGVPWLDVRLDPVQPQPRERLPQGEVKALPHVALARVAGDRAEADERALQVAPDDLAQVAEADNLLVLAAVDQEALEAVAGLTLQPLVESLFGGRGIDPRPMEPLAAPDRCESVGPTPFGQRGENDARQLP
jgi:hypothetical protein